MNHSLIFIIHEPLVDQGYTPNVVASENSHIAKKPWGWTEDERRQREKEAYWVLEGYSPYSINPGLAIFPMSSWTRKETIEELYSYSEVVVG